MGSGSEKQSYCQSYNEAKQTQGNAEVPVACDHDGPIRHGEARGGHHCRRNYCRKEAMQAAADDHVAQGDEELRMQLAERSEALHLRRTGQGTLVLSKPSVVHCSSTVNRHKTKKLPHGCTSTQKRCCRLQMQQGAADAIWRA